MLEICYHPKKGLYAEEAETLEKLEKNFFGSRKAGKIRLYPEEALFLMNFQNARCIGPAGKEIGFNGLASQYIGKEKRLFIKYNAYRDWRDRGLVARRLDGYKGKAAKRTSKRYPSGTLPEPAGGQASWYPHSMFSVLEDSERGRELFNDMWLGQFGIYKQDRGELLKMDFLETVFFAKHMGGTVRDVATGKRISPDGIIKEVTSEREYSRQLWEVYEEWRLKGYVVKSGFKFGSHFRIYFPGASPAKGGEWVHSKHVLHVFPKEEKMLVSEWARAVRVAHGVKKTFILGIPELKDAKEPDYEYFLAYRRKKVKGNWIRETPEDNPRYLLVGLSEDEHIGGVELASLLKMAHGMGLELLLSISDRETSITYYVLKRVALPGSRYEYYEIEWMKP